MNAYENLVKEITEYLEGHLKDGMDAERYARALVKEADYTGDCLHFEIPGRHSATGNPLPFSFETP